MRSSPLRLAIRIASAALLVGAIFMLAISVVIPRFVGGTALSVMSGSMSPTYPVGSVIVVRPVDPEDVRAGDVITYVEPGDVVTTHRVTNVDVNESGERLFTTKGDANRGEDPERVSEQSLRGRVWFHVPHVGPIRDWAASPWGLATIAILTLLASVWDRLAALTNRIRRPFPGKGGPYGLPSEAHTRTSPKIGDDGAGSPTATSHDPTNPTATSESAVSGPMPPLLGFGPDASGTTLHTFAQHLLLVRLAAGPLERGQILDILELTRGHVVALSCTEVVASISGTEIEIDGVERLLHSFDLIESSRSAAVVLGASPADGSPTSESMDSLFDESPAGSLARSASVSNPVPVPPPNRYCGQFVASGIDLQ